MRTATGFLLFISIASFGCGERVATFDGPTNDAFTGSVVHNGTPVSFAPDEASVKLFHEKGQSFGVPLQPDGSFKIGWMPIGKYSATLLRDKKTPDGKRGSAPSVYTIPGGLEIVAGKTQYAIELGKGWKP